MAGATIAGGYLLVLAITLPVAGFLLALALGGRGAERVALVCLPAGLAVSLLIAGGVWRANQAVVYVLGGWAPPLGVALRADGLSAAMLVTISVLMCAIALYARAPFRSAPGAPEARPAFIFWTLLLMLWGALNTAFLGEDLFTLYVALELLTFAAVPLVCLDGSAATLQAALRYLLFALLGSVLYLLGAVLVFGAYGTLDIILLSGQVRAEPAAFAAVALMTAGLLAKMALFPLHIWLPPAHAGAPSAASALLSALVVKAPFFLVVRLWFDVMRGVSLHQAAVVLGALGAAAILVGSVVALRQARLKLLIAYSTIAQIGYLFLIFPLLDDPAAAQPWNASAWNGGLFQVISHAFAKAAMFLAAGLIAESLGHDRIAEFRGIGRALPMTAFALGFSALSLTGLPPSGGFVAKWLLLTASVAAGQWWWAAVMLAGGLLAGGYMYRVIAPLLVDAEGAPPPLRGRIPRYRQGVALALALCSVLLGAAPLGLDQLLLIGRPGLQGIGAR